MSESEARGWLVFAREDLETAELELTTRPRRFACVNTQQAAEKALKAAIIASGVAPERTHDLDQLVQLVPSDWRVARTGADLSMLSQLAVQPRYPDTAMTLTDTDARIA